MSTQTKSKVSLSNKIYTRDICSIMNSDVSVCSEIPVAGKCFPKLPHDSVVATISVYNPDKQDTPKEVKKFRNYFQPEPSATTVHYGKCNDRELEIAKEMVHGSSVHGSSKAEDSVNPAPITNFQQSLHEKNENIYHSHKTAPVGYIPNQEDNLPSHVKVYETTFGKLNEKGDRASECLNPNISPEEIEMETAKFKEMYVKSHSDYAPGEQIMRDYDWSQWEKGKPFGYPTPNDPTGKHVKDSLYWSAQRLSDRGAVICNKGVADFRNRFDHKLGEVNDPIKESMRVSEDHAFGIIVPPDEYGAADLVHNRFPKEYLRGKDKLRALAAAVRQNLKNANYNQFDNLAAAFNHYDKNGKGYISKDDLRKVCNEMNLPIESDILEATFDFCDSSNTGQINYKEFSQFLNWKTHQDFLAVSSNGLVQPEESEPTIPRQIDKAVGDYKTTSSQINAVVGGIPSYEFRKYGVPSIRSDLPPPVVKKVSDPLNYGDESDAWGVVNPSIYSNHGVYEKEIFRGRDKNEIRDIFSKVYGEMSDAEFEKHWEYARSLHPRGNVSVETFRASLQHFE